MVRSLAALVVSAVLLIICMGLFFPFPNNHMIEYRAFFMSFPIRNEEGYVTLGIIGSIIFVIALLVLLLGLKKYHFRTLLIVVLVYSLLPKGLITLYQETFADGIDAVSYAGDGKCNFEHVSEDVLNGECELSLHNRSGKAITFELEFLDSLYKVGEPQMESLMNLAGPHMITIEANHEKKVLLKEMLDLSQTPNHIYGGSSKNVNIKVIDGDKERVL